MNCSEHDVIKEAVRQSEQKLNAQQSLAVASDQRALAFCAALFVVIPLTLQDIRQDGATWPERISLTLFIASAILAAYSARPIKFHVAGGAAEGVLPFKAAEHTTSLLIEMCERNDEYIRINNRAMKCATRVFSTALLMGFLAILTMYLEVVGLISYIMGEI